MINAGANNKPIPGRFDYLTPFYDKTHTIRSFIDDIDSLPSSDDIEIKAIPFSCERQPSEWFPNISNRAKKIKLIKKNGGILLFQMTYKYRDSDEEKEGTDRFFIIEHPEFSNVYTAVTLDSKRFFRRVLYPFFEGLFPRLTMTFISQKKLEKLLVKFQEDHQLSSLLITQAAQKFRYGNRKEFPTVSWPQMNLREAFDWIYQNNGWFKSLKFKAIRENSTIAEISITRQGIVQTNRHFSKVFQNFIQPVCKTIYENIEFFGNRSRLSNLALSAKPLAIDFGPGQFGDVSENQKFIHSMRRLDRASVSVIHGNPYIHLTIADYFDGSAFDLWVLNTGQLYIVPQMKGSVSSIKRIINHVFDTYAEGDIKDYTEVLD